MKALFITNIPAPYRVDFFSELGHLCDLTVIYERDSVKDRDQTWYKKNLPVHYKSVFLNGLKIGISSVLSLEIFPYLADSSYDIVIVGGYSNITGMLAIQYLSSKGRPFLLNADGGFPKQDPVWRRVVKRHFISRAGGWLSPSHKTDEYLLHYGAEGSKIYRYPFSSISKDDILETSLSGDQKREAKSALGIEYPYSVLSVGQFIPRKGFDVLIDACRVLPKTVGIYIVGGAPTEEYLAKKEQYGLDNLFFVSFQKSDVLKRYYMAVDIFVLPTRYDIWGLVINEAMACGLPIITTDQCGAGVELVIPGKNGYLVSVDDSAALSDKIMAILNNDALRAELSANSLSKIAPYTIENMADVTYQVMQEYLGLRTI